jgi:photosystem II stability/assembly factor-like uncharacterized protein
MRRAVCILLVCIGVIIISTIVCQAYTVKKLSKNGTSPSINDFGHVAWAAGGDKVVFYNGSSSKVLQSIPYVGHPQINNRDQILWRAGDYLSLFDGATIRQLSDSYDALDPHLSNGGQAVWEASGEILFFDGAATTTITQNTYPNRNPQLNGKGQIIWEGFDGEDYEIFLFDGIEIRQITSNSYDDTNPQINENGEIVWNAFDGNDWEIFYYDGTNINQLTENDYDDRYPNLNEYGDIVWQGRKDYWQVFLYQAHTITQLSAFRDNVSPGINNNGYVVWVNVTDMEDGIVVFDLSDSTSVHFSTLSTDPDPQINDRGYLVWHDYGVFIAIPAPVTILSPQGGEVFPSGSKQTIRWKTAEAGLTFDLKYSMNNGATWDSIAAGIPGYSYEWTVPAPIRNREKCLIRVIAYRAPGARLGADIPGTPFSIEVVKLTKPDDGATYLHPGDTYVLTWKTNITRKPVDSVQLFFTRDVTSSPVIWEEIARFGAGEYEAGYPWVVPDVQRSRRRCKLKLILRDISGEIVGIDRSDHYFAIQPLDASDEWIGLTSSGAYMLKLSFDPMDPHVLYAAGFNGRLYKTSDGGKTWDNLSQGIEDLWIECLAIDPSNPGTLYVGDASHKGIFKSTDHGQTWAPVAPMEYHDSTGFNPAILSLLIDPSCSNTLYAGTNWGVYKTMDGGASWNHCSQGIPLWGPNEQSTAVLTLTMHPANSNILYAGTSHENGLFKSIDGGANWMLANTGMSAFGPTPAVFALAVDPSIPNVLYAGTGYPENDAGTGVFKSSDGGETWVPANTGMNPWGSPYKILSLAIDPLVPTTLYAGSVYPGVFKSGDGGANWHPINRGLPRGKVLSLALDPLVHHTLFAGHLAGVFKIHQSHGRIAVKPNSFDFGSIPQGSILRRTITVRNEGPRRLRLEAISDPADFFSITGNTCDSGKVLIAGARCKITVQFAPLVAGSFTSSFTIDSDDPDNPRVTVTLSGTSGEADVIDKLSPLTLEVESNLYSWQRGEPMGRKRSQALAKREKEAANKLLSLDDTQSRIKI